MGELAEERAPNNFIVPQAEAGDIHDFQFSFLPFSLTLQIYEESKMNLEQERPFCLQYPRLLPGECGGPLLCRQGTRYLPHREAPLTLAIMPAGLSFLYQDILPPHTTIIIIFHFE